MKLLQSKYFPWFVCSLGALFYCYEYFLRIMPGVITADLMHFFGIGAASMGNLVAFYYYAYTPVQLPIGIMMDRYGPRKLLSIAAMVCAVGALLFSATDSYVVAATGRFMIGFGSAFAFVGTMKLATVWLPPKRFAMVSGGLTTLGVISGMFGTVWLAKILVAGSWYMFNYIAVVVGMVIAIVIFLCVRDEKDGEESDSEPVNWQSITRGFKIVLLNKQIWYVGLVGSILYSSLTVVAELWGGPFLKEFYGFSDVEVSKAISMVYLGWAIGAPAVGWLSDYFERRLLPLTVGILVSTLMLSIVLFVNVPVAYLHILLFIYGLFSSAEIVVFALGRELGPARLGGTSIAVVNMVVMLSGMLLQPMVGVLLDLVWSGKVADNIPVYSLFEYRFALFILPIGLLIALLLISGIQETSAKLRES